MSLASATRWMVSSEMRATVLPNYLAGQFGAREIRDVTSFLLALALFASALGSRTPRVAGNSQGLGGRGSFVGRGHRGAVLFSSPHSEEDRKLSAHRRLSLIMDTYGGNLKAAVNMLGALMKSTIPTLTYVNTNAGFGRGVDRPFDEARVHGAGQRDRRCGADQRRRRGLAADAEPEGRFVLLGLLSQRGREKRLQSGTG